MKFYHYGNRSAPLIIMLTGSFCPAAALDYLYEPLSKDFYILIPDYNGHYEGSADFTTRQNEAALIARYLSEKGKTSVAMLFGQSMGSEIGIELLRQMTEAGLEVAERTYERHTVLSELFIKLGVDEEHAVNDACKIEHVISSTTFAALKKHLNEDLK